MSGWADRLCYHYSTAITSNGRPLTKAPDYAYLSLMNWWLKLHLIELSLVLFVRLKCAKINEKNSKLFWL